MYISLPLIIILFPLFCQGFKDIIIKHEEIKSISALHHFA